MAKPGDEKQRVIATLVGSSATQESDKALASEVFDAAIELAAQRVCWACEEGKFPVFWDERKKRWAHTDKEQITVTCGATLFRALKGNAQGAGDTQGTG